MLISIITHYQPSPKIQFQPPNAPTEKKSQVYEKRPGNDADDIDISEVSENSQPFGITVSLYQYA